MDKLVPCKHCGSSICYEQQLEEGKVTVWMCPSCGFTTSSELTEGSELTLNTLKTSPELYKDLMFVDEDKHVWFPVTMLVPNIGMVFADGTSKEDWKWASAKAVELTKEELKSNKFMKDQKFRIDTKNIKHFDKSQFLEAMDEAGMLS